jgi:hypothetical protein
MVPQSTATMPSPDTGWSTVQPGLEQRIVNLFENRTLIEHVFMLRVDPTYHSFRLVYDPRSPKKLSEWAEQLGAPIVLNGGFFRVEDEQYLANGLLVIDDLAYGESYMGYGGMLTISREGYPGLRSLRQRPYLPDETFHYALQSFPLLVTPGGGIGFPAEYEDNLRARRTVIGRDVRGRFIMLVTTYSYFTLHRLSKWLVGSDLQLDIALNLDGGPSSGMLLAGSAEGVDSVSPLPVVIAVSPR